MLKEVEHATSSLKDAVILLSSGLDSAANLVLGEKAGFRVRVALTIDYGQRGALREIEQAAALARAFDIEHLVFDLSAFTRLVGQRSALLGGQDVPVPSSLDDLKIATKTAAAVWVPNRNGVMLSLAAALAESRGLQAVAVGFNAEEAVTFPDNTREYMRAMSESLRYSTSNAVEIVSATAKLTKTEIVKAISTLRFPFEHLWSCYHAGARHCSECESCQRLLRAVRSSLVGADRERVLKSLFGAE